MQLSFSPKGLHLQLGYAIIVIFPFNFLNFVIYLQQLRHPFILLVNNILPF